MQGNKGLHMVTYLLMVVGGLNWLLVGLFQWDIGVLFGDMGTMVSRVIYVLVGLATVYELACHKGCCKMCGMGMDKMGNNNTNSGNKMGM